MIIYSWNINGFHTCNSFGGYDSIINESPDFICFQEVKTSKPDELNYLFTMNYKQYYNFSESKGRNGVFIYSKHLPISITDKIGFDEFDRDGRFLCLEFNNFCLINVYMPHGGRDKSRLPFKLKSYSYLIKNIVTLKSKGKPIIIVGDFNIAHTDKDLERSKNNTNNIMFTEDERNTFSELLSTDLIDIYREFYPQKKEYTWWPYAFNAREKNIGWRIDYLLASKNGFIFNEIALRKDILGSDHCPIKANFRLPQVKK